MYRRKSGTASAAYSAGILPGRWTGKPSAYGNKKVRPGKTLLVSAKRAEELFGVDGVML